MWSQSESDTVQVIWLLMVMPPKHIFKAQASGLILTDWMWSE